MQQSVRTPTASYPGLSQISLLHADLATSHPIPSLSLSAENSWPCDDVMRWQEAECPLTKSESQLVATGGVTGRL